MIPQVRLRPMMHPKRKVEEVGVVVRIVAEVARKEARTAQLKLIKPHSSQMAKLSNISPRQSQVRFKPSRRPLLSSL